MTGCAGPAPCGRARSAAWCWSRWAARRAGSRPRKPQRLADDTARFWRGWLHRSTYTGRWREMVARSAITLKLMTYAPTGALVAAPTTGLPEQVGGERNWDYRYTWIRDGSFSIYALLGPGLRRGGGRVRRLAAGPGRRSRRASGSGPLKIMYRVDGTSDLVEETLDHFEGWRGSRPVRIGNGAADQLQLDIYGEAARRHLPGRRPRPAGRPPGLDGDWRASSTGCASTGTSPTRASGRPAAAGRTSPTAGSSPGWRWTARSGWPTQRGRPADIARWTADTRRDLPARSWSAAGTPRSARSPSTTTPRCSTPRCC